MSLFTSDNQPTTIKSRKGVKNKTTIIKEKYETFFNNDLTGIKPKEILKEVVLQLLVKESNTISEKELLVKIALKLLEYEMPVTKQEIIRKEVQQDNKMIIADTQEILAKFQTKGVQDDE
ncbi:hypothetical protein HUE87_04020 [Candidatus Sulfurimonas marisnigri]|uniref:Uncharacterized protein n=1 Tax=Candidatus Sulfurimonas marisnigri TaxID=2740405 RepID=A0A7S7M1I7_9BACT|nr:hypothetical protein [Candidatus Sulfurimonas marisnigri]QOY55412.1 hypothetical protein HUE87_04020 [Candidatus Sulfurimonas marisnigri]